MNKKLLIIIILTNLIITLKSAFSYEYTVDEKFLYQNYWLENTKNLQKIILSKSDILKYNQENLGKIPQLVDLKVFATQVQEKDVLDLISIYQIPQDPRYLGEIEVGEEYYQNIINNIDIDNISKDNFSYGFAIIKDNVKFFPTYDSLYEKPNDIEFDTLQVSAIYSGTPIIILHKSKDGKFSFIKTKHYTGWINNKAIVSANKKDWEDYIDAKDFIVVTANKLILSFNPYDKNTSDIIFYMGQKLPIIKDNKPNFVDNQSTVGNYIVKIPSKNSQGELEFKLVLIPFNEDISVGYLDYTKENIIKQLFKMQGDTYDWGGQTTGRDCSSYTQDVFNTFGIDIPRNTSWISNINGKITDFSNISDSSERDEILRKMDLGLLLLIQGHIFIYLGYSDGEHYVISNLSSVGGDNEIINEKGEKQLEKIFVNQVSITTLRPLRAKNSINFLDSLTKAIYIGE